MKFKSGLFHTNTFALLINTTLMVFFITVPTFVLTKNIYLAVGIGTLIFVFLVYLIFPAILLVNDSQLLITRPLRKQTNIDLKEIISLGTDGESGLAGELMYTIFINTHTSKDMSQDKGGKYFLGAYSKKDLTKAFKYIQEKYPHIEVHLPNKS